MGALGDSPPLVGSAPLLSVLVPQLVLHQVAPKSHWQGSLVAGWGVSAELSSLSVELQLFRLNTGAAGRVASMGPAGPGGRVLRAGPLPLGAAWAPSPVSVGRLSPGSSSVGAFVPGHQPFVRHRHRTASHGRVRLCLLAVTSTFLISGRVLVLRSRAVPGLSAWPLSSRDLGAPGIFLGPGPVRLLWKSAGRMAPSPAAPRWGERPEGLKAACSRVCPPWVPCSAGHGS